MKKNMRLKAVLILLIAMLMCFGSSVTAFAHSTGRSNVGTSSSVGTDTTISSYLGNIDNYNDIDKDLKQKIKRNYSTGYKAYNLKDGTTVYVAPGNETNVSSTINNLNSKAAADQSAANEKYVQKQDSVATDLGQISVTPDIQKANNMLSGFMPLLNMIVSVVIVGVTLGMTLFTAFDICYIEFPIFRNKCEDAKASGNKMMTRTDSKTGETKLRIVTDEAQYAIQAADTIQSGQNPLVIYFKKRFVAILLLAIVLFILLTGNMSVFSKIALKLVSGIISIVQSYS